MIIVEKVLKFILVNDYYNHDTLDILHSIYKNLDKYNIARDLVLKLEKFLITKKFININNVIENKMHQNPDELKDILKHAVDEELKVDMVILEKILQEYLTDKTIFKYSLGLLCNLSEKYIKTALKYVKQDPDTALYALASSQEKQAVPIILKNLSMVKDDTFKLCLKAIITHNQEAQILKILKGELNIQKKILILNTLQTLDIPSLKKAMFSLAKENVKYHPQIAVNSLKNVRYIETEEDINQIIELYNNLPLLYKKILSDVFKNLDSPEKKLENFICKILSKNLIKKASDFLKEIGQDDIKSGIVKALRSANPIEEINLINSYIEDNFEQMGPKLLLLKFLIKLEDKDLKFLAVQLILEGGYSKQLLNFQVDDNLLNIFINTLTRKKCGACTDFLAYYCIVDIPEMLSQSAFNFFMKLKLKNNIREIIEACIENKYFNPILIKTIGHIKLDRGLEYFEFISGHTNDINCIKEALYTARFYQAGQVYEAVKDYLNSSNPELVATALDSLIYVRYDKIKEQLPEYLESNDFKLKIEAIKGLMKFNMSFMEKVVDMLNNFSDKQLTMLFKNLKNVFNPTLLEILIYNFTQREYSSETTKYFFDYIKDYPNKDMIINKLNSVIKAI
ncbi:MAG: hypothetical protein ACQESP_09115 [Candidatus Muiribacteriota bacterium]